MTHSCPTRRSSDLMPVIDRFAKWMKDNPQIVGPVISALKTLAIVFGSLAVGGAIIAGVAAAFSLVSGPVLAVVGAIALLTLGLKRSEEHTSELQSLMRISYAVFCLKKKKTYTHTKKT